MKPIYLTLSLLLTAPIAYSAPQANASSQQASAQQLSVPIKGMTCSGCTQRIQAEITKLKAKYPQIETVDVSLPDNKATVKLSTTVSPQERQALLQEIAKAITEAGYEPVLDSGSPS